jgi:hypothetical protein
MSETKGSTMNETEYFSWVHTRVNHVQKLQTYVTNVISSAAVAIPALIVLALRILDPANGPSHLTDLLRVAFMPTYIAVMLTLLWAQLVSLYQTFCIFKLVRILGELELRAHSKITDMENLPYFPHGGVRRFYYALLHLLPTLYLVMLPVFAFTFGYRYLDDLFRPEHFLSYSLGIVLGAFLIWTLLLFRVFYCRYPLIFYMRPYPLIFCMRPFRQTLEAARERAKKAAKENFQKIQDKKSV